ncbi:MAG TPA: YbaN family protein [Gemmatimonadaceae bacterium]|nr:YbaN family protein [Gemmatimonadaceae bacterium]
MSLKIPADALERGPAAAVAVTLPARPTARPLRRAALVVCGTLSLGLGVLGIFVPLLPTTCFLLVAAWCYARSSQRLYDRLMRARWIGGYLRRYRDERSIPIHVKIASLVMMWITIGYSVLVFPNLAVRAALLVTAIAVTWHLYRLPAAR